MKNVEQKNREYRGALELIEEAVHLLRQTPAGVFACYYAGAAPFVLGLLYFWADMSRGAYAARHLAEASLILAALFVWMKTWQSVFARGLLRQVMELPPVSWSRRRVIRLVVSQTMLQSTSLIVTPLAALSIWPFGWAQAFYQSATVFGADRADTSSVRQRAWRQAQHWPRQNNLMLWMLSPWPLGLGLLLIFGVALLTGGNGAEAEVSAIVISLSLMLIVFLSSLFGIVAVNIATLIIVGAYLLNSLLGVQTAFIMSGWQAITNSTFLAVVFFSAYLILDPLVKATYVLRCFYGESLKSGEDLKTELRSIRAGRGALVAMLLFCCCSVALGARRPETGERPAAASMFMNQANEAGDIPPAELERAIQQELDRSIYSWRLPRESAAEEEEGEGLIRSWINDIGDRLKRWKNNLDRASERAARSSGRGVRGDRRGGMGLPAFFSVRPLLYLLLALVVGAGLYLGWQLWRRRMPVVTLAGQEVVVVPDLSDEHVIADALPANEWLVLARKYLEQGALTLALRAFYLASLAILAQRELITVAKYKSNRDYQRELQRRAHSQTSLLAVFAEHVDVFERAWYGLHEIDRGDVERFGQNYERIARHEPAS